MQTFSFSANHFSKADEEKELNEVTDVEKKEILDDKYGRHPKGAKNINNNNNNNNNNNDNDDISDKMLEEFHDAIEELPSDISGMFWRACLEADGVGDTEAIRFLRCENYNPRNAAIRMCEYWNTRYEIFGEEDAFKPMTLDGSMKSIVQDIVKLQNLVRILPDDDMGRTVICFDRTGIRFNDYAYIVLIKILWFVLHKALEKESTQRNGVVMIIIDQSLNWDFPSIKFLKLAHKTIYHGIPVTIRFRHHCVSSSVASIITPFVKYVMPRQARLRLQLHNCLHQPKLLNELESFGIQRKNLPRSIGGKYNEKPSWINECEQILRKQRKRSYEDSK